MDYNSGIGLIFNGSQESLANLSTNEIGLSYAYRLKLGENKYFRLGAMGSYMQRDAFFSDLVFGTQIDIINGTVGGLTDELNGIPIDSRYSFFDYSLGGMFYSDKVWLGVSAHHISEPNVSFVEGQICKEGEEITLHMLMQSGPFLLLLIISSKTPLTSWTWAHNYSWILWYWEYGIEDYQPKTVCQTMRQLLD
jgi:type IX secretion system PorP/SprF family membrane protein